MKVSVLLELRVLSGVQAGLVHLLQAAAVDGGVIRDVGQRVRTNQVPEREKKKSRGVADDEMMGALHSTNPSPLRSHSQA